MQAILTKRGNEVKFDKVQLCPKARQAIKHLVKGHRYDYIETGSLISIRKNVKSILIPSEEHRISTFPMDYEEFLWAVGDNTTYPLIRKCYKAGRPLGDQINWKLMRDSKTVLVSYHVNNPGSDMSAVKDLTKFKLFLCDTGLFYHFSVQRPGYFLRAKIFGEQRFPESSVVYRISFQC